MDIVLGVSMTATKVRMVLVEGERADGVTIEGEAFDTAAAEGLAKGSPSEQVSAAILATQQSALSSGHHLIVSGVTWVDQPGSAPLRDSVAARDLDNVVLVPEQRAAGALAQTVGRALGYDTTAVILVKPSTATLSIVDSANGSIVEARTCSIDSADPTDVLPEMVSVLEDGGSHPRGVFVVGAGIDVRSVKSNLESLISQPVIVPEEPEWALARGAALAAAFAPGFEASTSGLAYSQDPDTSADDRPGKLSDADTEVATIDCDEIDDRGGSPETRDRRRLLIPAGSLVAGIFVVGVVALVMSLAVTIRPTVEQGAPPATKATAPSAVMPPAAAQAPAAVQAGPPAPQAPPPAPDPASVVAQAASALPVAAPAVQAPAPAAQQPAPRRVGTAPGPVAAETPVAAPVAVDTPVPQAPPPPAPVALPPPLPALAAPPMPAAPPQPASLLPPVLRPAAQPSPIALSPFGPPSLWIQAQPSQQQPSQARQDRQWMQIPLGPQQQAAQAPQQLQPGPQIVLWPQRQTPPTPQWTPPQWTPPQASAQLPELSPPTQAPQSSPPPVSSPQLPQSLPTQPSPWQQQAPYGSPSSGSAGASSAHAGAADGSAPSTSPSAQGNGAAPWWPYHPGQ